MNVIKFLPFSSGLKVDAERTGSIPRSALAIVVQELGRHARCRRSREKFVP